MSSRVWHALFKNHSQGAAQLQENNVSSEKTHQQGSLINQWSWLTAHLSSFFTVYATGRVLLFWFSAFITASDCHPPWGRWSWHRRWWGRGTSSPAVTGGWWCQRPGPPAVKSWPVRKSAQSHSGLQLERKKEWRLIMKLCLCCRLFLTNSLEIVSILSSFVFHWKCILPKHVENSLLSLDKENEMNPNDSGMVHDQ